VLVDGAVPLGRVQKLASAFEDIIFVMSQHAVAVALNELGEFVLGLFVTQFEALRQSRYVTIRDQYPIIGATVSRTFRTVVTENCFYGLAVGPGRVDNG
jgi:hypothetical protein